MERTAGQRSEQYLIEAERLHAEGGSVRPELLTQLRSLQAMSAPVDMAARVDRAIAIVSVLSGDLTGAEQAIASGLGKYPDSVELYYLATFVHLQLHELHAAINSSNRFISLMESPSIGSRQIPGAVITTQHVAQLHNMRGAALADTGQLSDAQAAYQLAIAADPGNHLPYLNAARLFNARGDRKEALAMLHEGERSARETLELQMLRTSYQSSSRISACMIVKNEEELLPGCLDSLQGWVDELIVVDTGSTDRTVSIAEQYGARVFSQPWEGNFSKHRNHSLEQATGDWVLIIDADERVVADDVNQLKTLLQNGDHAIISLNVFNVYGKREETVNFLPSVRLFRRSLGLRYDGIVHNVLQVPPDAPVLRTGIRIKHLGYDLSPEKMHQKYLRSRALLERQLAEKPDDPFALFNFAQLIRGQGLEALETTSPDIIAAAERAVQLTGPAPDQFRHLHLMCLNQLGWTYFYLRDYEKATNYARRALAHKPDYLDPLLLLAHTALHQERYAEAKGLYYQYLEVQSAYQPEHETDDIIVAHVDARVNAYYSLAGIAEIEQEPDRAIDYYLQATAIIPDFLEANARLGHLFLAQGEFAQAERFLRIQLNSSTDSPQARTDLIELLVRTGRPEEARRLLETGSAGDDSAMFESRLLIAATEGDLNTIRSLLSLPGTTRPETERRSRGIADQLFASGHFSPLLELLRESAFQNETWALRLKGDALFKQAAYAEAVAAYRQAQEQGDTLPDTIRNLGLAQLRAGERKEAIPTLLDYLNTGIVDQSVASLLADLLLAGGNHQQAIPCLEICLRENPGDSSMLRKLADSYLALGHTEAARLGYRRVLTLTPGDKLAAQKLNRLREASPSIS